VHSKVHRKGYPLLFFKGFYAPNNRGCQAGRASKSWLCAARASFGTKPEQNRR
jgi:hypothetical protein